MEMLYLATQFSKAVLVVGGWSDWMTLELFSNLGDSLIL